MAAVEPRFKPAQRGWRRWRSACVLLFPLWTSACAVLPAREPAPAQARTRQAVPLAEQVTVRDAGGALPTASEQRVLAQLKAEGRGDLAEHHLRVLAAAAGDAQLYRGNRTRLLVDGPATLGAMKAAIAQARERILLESYIFEDSGLVAEVARLLIDRAAQGVRVAVLYDAVGSIGSDTKFFEALAAKGVAVCKFNPLNPLERPGYWSINHRNHRKLLVVDEAVAYAGGINISRVYSSGSFAGGRVGGGGRSGGGPKSDDDLLSDGWRDTHVELRGPVATELARGFRAIWQQQGCEQAGERLGAGVAGGPAATLVPVSAAAWAAPPSPAPVPATAPGTRVVKVLESDPAQDKNPIYTALLAAIDGAKVSVHLTMAYFAPGADTIAALVDAAWRGVDVQLVLPGRSDFSFVLHAGRSYYQELLDAGVRIYEIKDAVMHAKTAVIDGVWSTVGSSNLDWRSIVANNELNVIVIGDDFGQELEALFARDVSKAQAIEAGAWRKREWTQRLKEKVGRLAERLL